MKDATCAEGLCRRDFMPRGRPFAGMGDSCQLRWGSLTANGAPRLRKLTRGVGGLSEATGLPESQPAGETSTLAYQALSHAHVFRSSLETATALSAQWRRQRHQVALTQRYGEDVPFGYDDPEDILDLRYPD